MQLTQRIYKASIGSKSVFAQFQVSHFSTKPNDPNDHNAKDHNRLHSVGSQVETEWLRPVKGRDYDPNDKEGYDVPSVFREHRHQYSAKPQDVNAYRRQITYRVGHIGTKELEVIFRDYMTMYSAAMTYQDLEQFDDEVLNIENPQLQRYLVNGDALLPEHDTKYMKALMLYVDGRKTDYAKYTPSKTY